MSPDFAMDNIAYGGGINAILLGKMGVSLALSSALAYFKNLCIGQFGILVMYAFRRCMSAFKGHVVIIVSTSTKPEMRRIHASRIVTSVKYAYAFWYRAIVKLIANAMSEFLTISGSNTKNTVSALFGSAVPRPAIVRRSWFNICPKGLFGRVQWISVLSPWKFSRRVSKNVATWLAFGIAKVGVRTVGNWRKLAAATLTVAVWLKQAMFGNPGGVIFEVCREMRNAVMMGSHGSSLLSCQAQGRYQRRLGNSIGCYRSSIAQMSGVAKC